MYSPSFSPSRSLSLTTLPFSSTLSLRFLFSLSLSSNPFLYFLSSPPPPLTLTPLPLPHPPSLFPPLPLFPVTPSLSHRNRLAEHEGEVVDLETKLERVIYMYTCTVKYYTLYIHVHVHVH